LTDPTGLRDSLQTQAAPRATQRLLSRDGGLSRQDEAQGDGPGLFCSPQRDANEGAAVLASQEHMAPTSGFRPPRRGAAAAVPPPLWGFFSFKKRKKTKKKEKKRT